MYVLIATLSIALVSLIGAFFSRNVHSARIHQIIIPVAIGVFLGVVFFELLPETFEASHTWGPLTVVIGFLGFYLLSHALETMHSHSENGDTRKERTGSGGRMLLIGDAIHNVADGVVIASAFTINPVVGVMTTIGIALHEIPQEIAEFSVLLESGYTRGRALFLNFLSASSIFVGALATLLIAETAESYLFILTGITAGNLLYIAASDLLPELRHSHREHFKKTFFATLIGLIAMGTLITYSHKLFGEHIDRAQSPLRAEV